jgi:hypothetical protein
MAQSSLFQQDDPLQRSKKMMQHTTKCLVSSLLAVIGSSDDLLVPPKEYANRLCMQEDAIRHLQATVAALKSSLAQKEEEIAKANHERDQAYNVRNQTLLDSTTMGEQMRLDYQTTQNHNITLSRQLVASHKEIARLRKAVSTFMSAR